MFVLFWVKMICLHPNSIPICTSCIVCIGRTERKEWSAVLCHYQWAACTPHIGHLESQVALQVALYSALQHSSLSYIGHSESQVALYFWQFPCRFCIILLLSSHIGHSIFNIFGNFLAGCIFFRVPSKYQLGACTHWSFWEPSCIGRVMGLLTE